MPLYIKEKDVKARLVGKVRFTSDPCDENKMSEALLTRLVDEAEGEVELDLSVRYSNPFLTDGGGPFAQLPMRPTQNILRELCELKAVCRVLETDFGAGTVVDAEKYKGSQESRYKSLMDRLVMHRDPTHDNSQWKYPPLPGLQLNYQNNQSDDGFAGQVLTTGDQSGSGDYPSRRINDPSQSYYGGSLENEPGVDRRLW